MLNYVNEVPGIGEVLQQSTPITVIRGIILTTPDFEFASKTSFATEADYLSAIAAGKMYPIPNILESESQNFEDKVLETSTGKKVFQFEGVRGWLLKSVLSLTQHKLLRQYSFKNWRVFYIDENNNIRGYSPDGTKVKGYKLGMFRVLKQGSPSANDAAFSTIQLQEAHIEEWDKYGVMVNPTFLASDLTGVLDIKITAGSVTSNSVQVTANYVDDSQLTPAGANDSVSVSGLVAANVRIMNGSTEVTTGKTVTESSTVPGTYTVAATTLVAGYTVQIIASSANLYKSDPITLS